MTRIGVIDYGLGNLPSATKALERAGAAVELITEPSGFDHDLDAVVLPGVGHFGAGARNLDEAGFSDPLREWARAGRPLLGICVGLQLFMQTSEEDPDARGLGILEGTCRRLKADTVPHMGWNTLELSADAGPARVVAPDEMVYFVHSFYVAPDPSAVVGTTEYGEEFCSVARQDSVLGVQFHPEKSAEVGVKLLRAFVQSL